MVDIMDAGGSALLTQDSFKPYVFEDGYVSTEPFANFNMLGATGLSWIIRRIVNGTPVPAAEAYELTRRCWVVPGLFRRHPHGVGGRQAADDYYCFLAGLAVNGYTSLASNTLLYGLNHSWCFNSERPGLYWPPKTWFWRFPALIAHMHYAAGVSPEPEAFITRRFWATLDPWKDFTQDGFIQDWCRIKTVKYFTGATGGELEHVRRWEETVRARGISLSDILRAHMRSAPDHPLIRFSRGL